MVSDGPCPRAMYKNFSLHHYYCVSLRSRTSIIWVRWRLSCLNARSFDRPPARPSVRSFACLPAAERLDFPSFPSEFNVSRSTLLWHLPLQLEYETLKCVGLLTFRNLSYLGIKLSELTSCALKYARSSIGLRLLVVSSRLVCHPALSHTSEIATHRPIGCQISCLSLSQKRLGRAGTNLACVKRAPMPIYGIFFRI